MNDYCHKSIINYIISYLILFCFLFNEQNPNVMSLNSRIIKNLLKKEWLGRLILKKDEYTEVLIEIEKRIYHRQDICINFLSIGVEEQF